MAPRDSHVLVQTNNQLPHKTEAHRGAGSLFCYTFRGFMGEMADNEHKRERRLRGRKWIWGATLSLTHLPRSRAARGSNSALECGFWVSFLLRIHSKTATWQAPEPSRFTPVSLGISLPDGAPTDLSPPRHPFPHFPCLINWSRSWMCWACTRPRVLSVITWSPKSSHLLNICCIQLSWKERLKLFKLLYLMRFPNQIWEETSQGQTEPKAGREQWCLGSWAWPLNFPFVLPHPNLPATQF